MRSHAGAWEREKTQYLTAPARSRLGIPRIEALQSFISGRAQYNMIAKLVHEHRERFPEEWYEFFGG